MPSRLNDKEIINIAKKTLSKYKLCNHCLGRIFAKIGKGITNQKRGETLRNILKDDEKVDVKNCWLCSGLMDEIKHFAYITIDSLKKYEYETFLVGSKVD